MKFFYILFLFILFSDILLFSQTNMPNTNNYLIQDSALREPDPFNHYLSGLRGGSIGGLVGMLPGGLLGVLIAAPEIQKSGSYSIYTFFAYFIFGALVGENVGFSIGSSVNIYNYGVKSDYGSSFVGILIPSLLVSGLTTTPWVIYYPTNQSSALLGLGITSVIISFLQPILGRAFFLLFKKPNSIRFGVIPSSDGANIFFKVTF